MTDFWRLGLWAKAIIAVALMGAFDLIPDEVSATLVITLPTLAISTLKGRECFGKGRCA